jgi:hypothetical protein
MPDLSLNGNSYSRKQDCPIKATSKKRNLFRKDNFITLFFISLSEDFTEVKFQI